MATPVLRRAAAAAVLVPLLAATVGGQDAPARPADVIVCGAEPQVRFGRRQQPDVPERSALMPSCLRLPLLVLIGVSAAAAAPVDAGTSQRRGAPTAPETFTSQLQARSDTGAFAAFVRVQIDDYSRDDDRQAMANALASGGNAAFVEALRRAPAVGSVSVGDVKVIVRWAREQATPKGRAITVITETPVYFIGGGRADAPPREGFDVAVVQIDVDEIGLGTGTIAAAARVKPDGAGGVMVEDYAAEPTRLTLVSRVIR